MLKQFGISFISFIVLDFIWLGFVVKRFNLRQLAEIGRIEDGDFKIMYAPALFVYVLMAALVTFFVLPKFSDESTVGQVLAWGALLGFLVYGVYDMTNLSILKNYPIAFSMTDMAWGTAVFAMVSMITWKLS